MTPHRIWLIRAVCVLALSVHVAGCTVSPPLADGDIIFQTSRSSRSLAIQEATTSPYSHMGLVLFRGGKPYVFEAAATSLYTPLKAWIARGEGGHYVVKRLKNSADVLTPDALRRLRAQADALQGRPYDLRFEWSDGKMYCSELVWKIYDRGLHLQVGELQKVGELALSSPTVRAKLRERYGDRVPTQELVITPAAMFASPLLVTVVEDR